jgi:hypothetical protein
MKISFLSSAVFFLLLLFHSFSLQSQAELRIGGGLNASSFPSTIEGLSLSSATGYQFGADLQFGDRLYFQLGLHIENMKTEINPPPSAISVDDFEINRLRVPVYLGYRFASSKSWLNLRLFTGPNASLVINRQLDGGLGIDKDDFSSVLFGYNVGAGLDIAFIFLDVGYMFGLNDTLEFGDSSSSNNLFFANTGLRLKF